MICKYLFPQKHLFNINLKLPYDMKKEYASTLTEWIKNYNLEVKEIKNKNRN